MGELAELAARSSPNRYQGRREVTEQFVDPDKVVADHAEGVDFEEIHAKAVAGGYAPEQAPVEIPEAEVADQEPAWAV